MGDNDVFKSKVEQEVLRSWWKARRSAEEKRQEDASMRLAIYHDDWEQYLTDRLQAQFLPENFGNIKLNRNMSQNPVKKVVNETSMIYRDPARRVLATKAGVELPIDATPYGYLDVQGTMDLALKYRRLLNNVGVLVGWDAQRKRVRLSLLTPANTSVVQRDGVPEECAGFFYRVDYIDDMGGKQHYFVYWDDVQCYKFDEKGVVSDPSDDGTNAEMVNPYQRMPVVWLRKALRPGMFWDPTDGFDLIDCGLNTGVKRTMSDYAFKLNSFKQLWMRTQAGELPPQKVLLDIGKVLALKGDTAEVGVLDLQADFAAIESHIASGIDASLATYGLSLSMFTTEDISGRALEVKNRGLRDIRKGDVDAFGRYEQELFELIRLVDKTFGAKSIPDDALFQVTFPEPEIVVDKKTEREQDEWDLKHGLISPAQLYMKRNPDVKDPKVAMQRIAENLVALSEMKDQGFSIDEQAGAQAPEVPPTE